MINVCYIVRCGLNEALGIFQLSFIAESGEKFCAKLNETWLEGT